MYILIIKTVAGKIRIITRENTFKDKLGTLEKSTFLWVVSIPCS